MQSLSVAVGSLVVKLWAVRSDLSLPALSNASAAILPFLT